MSDVAVLGLGAMGSALAGALLDGGHTVTVWNRTGHRAAALAERGAEVATTAAGALRAAPVAVVCLTDDAAVRETLVAVPGRTLVNLTNSTPEQDRGLADWAARRQMTYLAGGIMAVPSMIGTPAAFVFYSGDAGALQRHRALLERFGGVEYTGADPGRAAVHDLALLTAMYGMFGGFLHAAALISAEGIPVAGVEPLIRGWLTAMTGALPAMASAIDSGDHTATGSTVRMQALAYPNLLDAGRERGLDNGLVQPMGELLTRAVSSGHGDADLSVLATMLHGGRVRRENEQQIDP
ncbi:NAD(P)-dependent oxidoreductase [Actinoplanes xinjiangensis]|uniref:3-hydroxyisobutyrate dehydrogenase-like beta-hydroxyacid dehydrogenase n=1 Tax=Actinoplanes xinjiangensis TaxID=512350 RepID=A0A316FFX9_9ACTN|nr:NAD(P)-binding domain-containing protein [Actinoplanes xinjiangensis]PWK46985.1 3-hydroxyisobutyrate dehydrogenase-like beta-hydroxyacid dehydrogenase [Actinoplanes xinjiangensis]GIF40144.1 dehydrogenase [Actinoplanes xinjiangensis]